MPLHCVQHNCGMMLRCHICVLGAKLDATSASPHLSFRFFMIGMSMHRPINQHLLMAMLHFLLNGGGQ
jgi:hypothetical protein